MQDVMLDLETFGLKHGSVIRSIGAIFFEPRSIGYGYQFYENIDKQSCLDLGMTVDPKTEAWWDQQEQSAKDALVGNTRHFTDAANNFHEWFKLHGGVRVWCNGANFDAPLWESVVQLIGVEAPWKYYNVRDTRTCYDLALFNPKSLPTVGTSHNALDDCKFQINCVQTAIRKLAPRY